MNKAELINAAAEKAGLSKKDTENAPNAAPDVIAPPLAENDTIQLEGLAAPNGRSFIQVTSPHLIRDL